MSRFITLILLILVAMPLARAAAEPYAGISAGVSFMNTSNVYSNGVTESHHYAGGPNVNVCGGYRIDRHRFELEYGYHNMPINSITTGSVTKAATDADLTVSSVMAGYYANLFDYPVTPFVGAGLGVVHAELKDPAGSASGMTLGMQFSAGATYHLNKRLDLDIVYHYQFSNTTIRTGDGSISYGSSSLATGARYYF